jgi:hypothetical protein
MMQGSFTRKVVLATLLGTLGVLAQQPDVPTYVFLNRRVFILFLFYS